MSSTAFNSATTQAGLAYIQHDSIDSGLGLVLVHGWGCQSTDYSKVLSELAKQNSNYLAVAPDLPGHGHSPKDLCPTPSMSNLAATVISFCQELKLHDVVLLGHSMGVRIVADAWRQITHSPSPPHVKGLVFLDGSNYTLRPSLFAFDKGDARSSTMSDDERARQKAAAVDNMFSPLTPEAFRASTLSHILAMDKSYSEEMRASMIRYDREQMDQTMKEFAKSRIPLCNVQSSDIGPDNQRVAMQIGGQSRWMKYVGERVPLVKQIVIDQSGHFPHVDKPDVVAKIIMDFVDEVRKQG